MVASVSPSPTIYRERPPTLWFVHFEWSRASVSLQEPCSRLGPQPLRENLYITYPNILGEERPQMKQYRHQGQSRKAFVVKKGVHHFSCEEVSTSTANVKGFLPALVCFTVERS